MESREDFKLSLRKEKLDNMFLSKRTKYLTQSEEIEINTEKLNLPINVAEKKFTSLDDLLCSLDSYLSSSADDIVKYGIVSLRKLLSSKDTPISKIIEKRFFEKLIKLLEKYSDDASIIVKSLLLYSMRFYGVLLI